jgi:hypothetical protein
MSGVTDFLNIFFGSTQSQVTAYAILAAIIAICITVLLTKTDMNIGDKFLLIFFILLSLVPGVFLILFEITCMVTGGSKDKQWWCWLYAWVVAVFVIIYCVIVVFISFSSLFTYNTAIEKIEMNENKNKMSPQDSNDYAKAIIKSSEHLETFQNNAIENTINSLMLSADNNEKKEEDGYINNELFTAIPQGKKIELPTTDIKSTFVNKQKTEVDNIDEHYANKQKTEVVNMDEHYANKQKSPFVGNINIMDEYFANKQKSEFIGYGPNKKEESISKFGNISPYSLEQISPFIGGNEGFAYIENFATKKTAEDTKPKEKKEKKQEEQVKAEFKGSKTIDEEEEVEKEEKTTKPEEDESDNVVESFIGMDMRYSKY